MFPSGFCRLLGPARLAMVIGAIVWATGRAQPGAAQEPAKALANVPSLLERRAFDRAREELDKQLAVPEGIGTSDLAKLFFYRALADHREASEGAASDRAALLESAAGYYERAIEIQPDWPPALNNLAQIRIAQGRKDQVGQLYEAALARGERHRSLYATNYADFLADEGDPTAAVKYLELAAELEQGPSAAHDRVVAHYRAGRQTEPLLAYLWKLAQLGNVDPALDAALSMLERQEPGTESAVRELFALVAYCVSRQPIAPDWSASKLASRLDTISSMPGLNEPAGGITDVILEKSFDRDHYSWWISPDYDASHDLVRGMWPKDAFTALITALGNRQRYAERFELAEKYYRLAIDFVPGDIDPDALLALADMFVSRNQLDDLERMIDQYEEIAFVSKNNAYRGSRLDRIYRFHRALGIIYVRLQRWGDSSNIHSAIFQLDRALQVVDQYNELHGASGKRRTVEPQLVSLLAEAYEKRGSEGEATRLRLAYADRFAASKDVAAASFLVRDAESHGVLPDNDIADLRRIKSALQELQIQQEPQRFAREQLRSAGPLVFGPDGILFVGDPLAAAIFAVQTEDRRGNPASAQHEVEDLGGRIARLLRSSRDDILIHDLAVNPASGNVYLSLSNGRGPNARPAVVRVDRRGISAISISEAVVSRVALPNPPADSKDRKLDLRENSITDLQFVAGMLYVAGLSDGEFASTITTIPYPFDKTADWGTGVEIFHGAHGRLESHAPVRTFAPYDIEGQRYLLCAFAGTPLVKLPAGSLEPRHRVRATTIAELGNRNIPLGMFVYDKDGRDYILVANSTRGVMKFAADTIARAEGITQRVVSGGGLKYETIGDLAGVMHLDRLDADRAVVLVTTSKGTIDLKTIPLP